MGQWQIRGADRASGRDVGQIYDAATRDDAATMAANDGMLVETIELLADDPTPSGEALGEFGAAIRREASLHAGEGPHRSATPTLDYGNAAHHADRGNGPPPNYGGLLLAGRIIRGLAFVYYMFGIVVLGMMLWSFAIDARSSSYFPSDVLSLLGATTIGMMGAVLHGVGSGCFALRDIARNSWR